MIQIDGIPKPRCGSLARIGLPVGVRSPEMTQLLEPTPRPPTRPPPPPNPAISATPDARWASATSAAAACPRRAPARGRVRHDQRPSPRPRRLSRRGTGLAGRPVPGAVAEDVRRRDDGGVRVIGREQLVRSRGSPSSSSAGSRKISSRRSRRATRPGPSATLRCRAGSTAPARTRRCRRYPERTPATTNGVESRPLFSRIQAFTPSA